MTTGPKPLVNMTGFFNKKTAIERSQFAKKVRIKERENHSRIGQRWFHEWLGIWTKSRVVSRSSHWIFSNRHWSGFSRFQQFPQHQSPQSLLPRNLGHHPVCAQVLCSSL